MKNAIVIGLLSVLALAVVGTVGSVATSASALLEDEEKLKCKVLDGKKDSDKYDDSDYIKLKCKIIDKDGRAPDMD
jgi:hypothetical protein